MEEESKKINSVKITEVSRLDKYLKKLNLPYGLLQKWIRKKLIRVNGNRVDGHYMLQKGDIVQTPSYEIAPESPHKILTEMDKKRIRSYLLYEDEDIIVLNKPGGLAVQGGSKVEHHIDGLLEGLKRPQDMTSPKLVHRLDKETSGLLLLARTTSVAHYLTSLFKTKEIQKTYWALVWGTPPQKKGKIELPLKKNSFNGQERMCIDAEGREAITLYEILGKRGEVSFVELKPLTGRTHQLRVHMEALGCPILGDTKYKGEEKDSKGFRRLHLHAYEMNFIHPRNSKKIKFQAPLDDELLKSWQSFGF